jgi:AraC family transcriptional regulator
MESLLVKRNSHWAGVEEMSLETLHGSEVAARQPPSAAHQSPPLIPSTSERVARLVHHALTLLEGDRGAAGRYLSVASSLLTNDLDIEQARQAAVAGRCTLARWQANRVFDYMESKLESKLCVDDLAKVVSLSKSHFSRAFRQETGMPPMVYVMLRRIERAKVMMTSTECRLSEVAVACGFADQSHLTRCFRRVVGLPPSRYRRIQAFEPRRHRSEFCS